MEQVSPLQMNTSSFPSLLASSPGAPTLSFPRLKSLDWSCMLLVEELQGGKARVLCSSSFRSACHAAGQQARSPAKGLGQDRVGTCGHHLSSVLPALQDNPKEGPHVRSTVSDSGAHHPSGSLEDYTVGARKGLILGG